MSLGKGFEVSKIPAIPRVFFATYGSGSELSAAVPCFPPRWSWTPIPLEP